MMIVDRSLPDFYCQDGIKYENLQLKVRRKNDMVMFFIVVVCRNVNAKI